MLFDNGMLTYDLINMSLFEHESKNIKSLLYSQSKPKHAKQKPFTSKKIKKIRLTGAKNLQKEVKKGAHVIILTAKEVPKEPVDLWSHSHN